MSNEKKFEFPTGTPRWITGIDWTDLRTQKTTLLKVMDTLKSPEQVDDLEGILAVIDSLQDYVVDELGVPEMHVFDLELEEEREQSTAEELFAMHSARRLFDDLCESDGFHQDDQMPVAFIESIMADDKHADIIKALLKSQILDDMLNNCPQEFTYNQDGYVYDGDIREDYEGVVTKYLRDLFNEDKTKTLWLCSNCGSDNIDIKAWVRANTNEILDGTTDGDGEEHGFCNDCEENMIPITAEIKLNSKIEGFQVVGMEGHENEGEIHPDMEGSFCLYSLSQARAMMESDDTMYKGEWKLLAVWTGDVEEPTMMFSGNPRN